MTTVTEMDTLALDLADMTGSSFPVAARSVDYANTALRILHNALANTNEDYFLTKQTITIVSGTEQYALNANFMRAIKLMYEVNGRRYPIDKFSLHDIHGYRTSPLQAGTAYLWYIPKPTVFTGTGDSLADIYPSGAEDYIAYHMAIQYLIREESTEQYQMLLGERKRILQSVMDVISPRDEESDQVVDVYGRWNDQAHLFASTEERFYKYRIMGTNLHVIEAEWRGV